MSYNIFVIFTQYQFQCVKNIINNGNTVQSIIITTIPINSAEFKGEVYFFEKINSLQSLINEVYCRKRKKVFLQIKDTSKKYKTINIFIPHYFNINSNYISTSLFHDANINILPDGILSFYPYKLTNKNIIKQFLNKVIALSIGLNYKLFFSNIVDPFNKVKKIYSYNPDITYTYGKEVNQIPYTKKNIPVDQHSNNMIILGTSSKLNNESEIIEKIISFIKKSKISNIYYKMHPSQTEDPIYAGLSNNIINLELLTEQTGAENLIEKYSLNIILSVEFSTALLEIQRQYNNQLYCYINKTTIFNHSRYKTYFEKLLKYYQVEELT